ncbi:MAG: hypothetical protein ABI369_07155 [Acetobacteraceae bacterium]
MAVIPRAYATMDKVADQQVPGARAPSGIAFTIPELMMLTAWSEFHDIRLVIELDNCIDGAEYEEVAALYPRDSPLRRWTLWRGPDAIVAEPMHGPGLRAGCIAELLNRLMPAS